MKKLLLKTVLVLGIGSAGCAAPKHVMKTQFNEAEFAPYATDGKASIHGQAFLKTRGGEVRYGAGDPVYLFPVTPYSKEVWGAAAKGESTDKDPRWKKYQRDTIADGNGNFEFKNLPAGDYFIECPIFWEAPSELGTIRTGGNVRKEISLKDGEDLKVILTQ